MKRFVGARAQVTGLLVMLVCLNVAVAGAGTAAGDVGPKSLSVSLAGAGGGEVTSSPAGIDCSTTPSTCMHQFAYGTSVTLTVASAARSSFDGWSGACTGTGTCSVTMSLDKAVTATFSVNSPPVSQCVVPKLKGKTLRTARRALKAHSCALGSIRHAFSSKVKEGHVISQKPRSGRHLTHGAKVDLALSKGKH